MSMVIYGINPVLEALQSGAALESVVMVTGAVDSNRQEIERLARKAGVALRKAPRKELDRLSDDGVHQGVVAIWGAPPQVDLEEMIQVDKPGRKLVVCLDEVQDPRNLGALARSALAFGALGLVVPARRSAKPTPAAIKASAGALCRLPVALETNLGRALDRLKKNGFWVTGAVAQGGQLPWEFDPGERIALVLGAEGSGIRRGIDTRLDFRVRVPMLAETESLNVSVAGALLMYEWLVRP